ncbi:MAG: hypothetical protein M1819_007443 [Sarea resinae]|nr:MAG: hypothetical protein M1819_007443 [Sarea resinae]
MPNQGPATRPRRHRPSSKNGSPSESTAAQQSSRSLNGKRKRGRPSLAELATRLPDNDTSLQATGTHSKRTSLGDDNDDGDKTRKKFATLKPRTRHVPWETVRTQWEPLSDSAQAHVRELFRAVERPVVTGHLDEGKRAESQSALSSILRKLESKLPKMPFPLNTRDVYFDYEKLLDSTRGLESQLTPSIHSVALLRAEIEREERALADEKEQLDELETNAAASETRHRKQAKKLHPLLQTPLHAKGHEDNAKLVRLIKPDPLEPRLVDDQDPDLEPIVQQLRNHLDSIQSNTTQINDLGKALLRTRVAVDNALYERLESEQYNQLAGG